MEPKAYDPRLRSAMKEIKGIAEKYNIGVHVLLASNTHSEFYMGFDVPDWSAMSFTTENSTRRVFAFKANIAKPSDHEKLETTMHMLLSFRDMMINHAAFISAIESEVSNRLDIAHRSRIGKRPDSWPLNT